MKATNTKTLYRTARIQLDAEIEHQHTMPDGTILIGYLKPDQDCANPCKGCDGMGQVRSLSNRHIDNIDADEAVELLKNDPMVVALSYFEHGLSLWDVQGGPRFGACPDKQWDGVSFAGVWIPGDCCREEITSRLANKSAGPDAIQEVARVLAAECCKEYTDWSNGNCWGYIIERYNADGELIERVDSCWGFIGDYSKEALREAFDSAIAD